jgi:hypothetical protein
MGFSHSSTSKQSGYLIGVYETETYYIGRYFIIDYVLSVETRSDYGPLEGTMKSHENCEIAKL